MAQEKWTGQAWIGHETRTQEACQTNKIIEDLLNY